MGKESLRIVLTALVVLALLLGFVPIPGAEEACDGATCQCSASVYPSHQFKENNNKPVLDKK